MIDENAPAVDLAIVIVNWNGGALLQRCLNSIRASQCSALLEVLVIDNHSADGSREAAVAAFPEFRVIDSGANLGFGRANNFARNLTNARLVLFLNPDTELQADTLDVAIRALEHHPEAGALGCKMLYSDGSTQELGLQWDLTASTTLLESLVVTSRTRHWLQRWLPTVDPHRSGYVRKLYGGFMMARRDVLDAAGWFDERYFMYAEDADLCRTILGLGWKLYYCSEATIVHSVGGATVSAPSGFGSLMKHESVNKLISKYDGAFSAGLHRGIVLFGSVLRLGAALVPLSVAAVRRYGVRRSAWKIRCRKQAQLALWALGLKKPRAPEYPPIQEAISTPLERSLPLSCKVFHNFEALDDLRTEWDRAVAAASGSIYMTYDWVRLWWQFYGGSAQLKLFLFWSAERLVAVVPMYVETLGAGPLHFRIARLVGANIPPRVFNPPVPEQYASEVFTRILVELFTRCDCDFMSFGPVSQSESGTAALTSACHGLRGEVELRKSAETVHTAYDLPPNMAEYYQGLSKNERKHRKKFELRLLKNEYPDARLETVSTPARVVEEFDLFVEQHRRQWFMKGKLGHFGSWPRATEFHRAIVAAQAKLERVRFLDIVADGQVIARKYLFVFAGRYYAELNARSVDPKWERYSLGPSGAVAVIEQGIAEGMKRIESGLEHYDHKARLGAKEYAAITMRVVHSRLRSRICFVLFSLLRGCMSIGYHKLWYRRISPRLPRFFWRPQWRPWLRLDF